MYARTYYDGKWYSWKKIAFTSDIPTVTNYYWANIPISATSSTTTNPIFNITKTKRINIYGEEVTDYTKGLYFLASDNSFRARLYYNGNEGDGLLGLESRSSNISIMPPSSKCVGIGTTSPSYKLHVNGTLGVSGITTFNINNQWLTPSVLQIGRADTSKGTSKAVIGVTNGNLHIDAYHNNGLYLNYYNKGKIKFGYQTDSYYISEDGSYYSGNSASATKLTSSAGSATLPIYFSDGKPVACTASSLFSNLSNSRNNISITVAG